MKKFIAMLVALAIAFVASFALASPAAADHSNGHSGPTVGGKDVTLCHATSSTKNPYVKVTVSVVQFFEKNGENGHADHAGDIWASFTYYEKVNGEWVEKTQAAQGNTDLLQYDKCKSTDKKIAAPAVAVNDPCVTKNDSVTPAKSDKYTAVVTKDGLAYTVVATATGDNEFDPAKSEGWTLTEDNTVATKVFTLTNVDCDLPETGSKTTNVVGGIVILALLGALGFYLLRRRNSV